ncbi:hypothetical protein CN918_24800 [Priestia megaterium]|nr:hypothetical protein CN533_22760 [Priestia megaterium]PFI69677.1 hypothetical protein COI68_00325 [Priestia megaterium]PGK52736.1 hypothetical protein CN918_24800 [Priestia megaterium]PGN00215.1 hypothetical protein CN955_27610 [Priestia megaterium]
MKTGLNKDLFSFFRKIGSCTICLISKKEINFQKIIKYKNYFKNLLNLVKSACNIKTRKRFLKSCIGGIVGEKK